MAGAGALYGWLRLAAALLTDGELNYSGVKIFYGIVVLAVLLGLLTIVARAGAAGILTGLITTIALAVVLQASPTGRLIAD